MSLSSGDGIQISYCNTPQCKICRLNALDQEHTFHSNLNANSYHTPNPSYQITESGSCKSANCVYQICCRNPDCHMVYIGFTTTALNKRLSGHRANLTNNTEGKGMLQYFKHHHLISDMVIKPIEFCERNMLRIRERYWILELNSAFPYGLNDRVDWADIRDTYDHVINNKSSKSIYSNFNFQKNNRTKRGSGINKKLSQRVPLDLDKLINNIIEETKDKICNQARKSIMKLNITDIRKLLIHVSTLIHNSDNKYKYNEFLLYVIKDICLYKLACSHKTRIYNKNTNFIIVPFINKLVDHINLNNILNSKNIYNLFPANFMKPSISYIYSPTIRGTITNYQEVVKQAEFYDGVCVCHYYPNFVDSHHKHVLTGNLDFISNKDLKSLLQKGLNYREQQPVNKDRTFSAIQNSIETYINKISNTIKLPIITFLPWKTEILAQVKTVIDNYVIHPFHKVLNNAGTMFYLNNLHKHFVLVPVDKASNNICIICRQFYLQVLEQEIQDSGNFILHNQTRNRYSRT